MNHDPITGRRYTPLEELALKVADGWEYDEQSGTVRPPGHKPVQQNARARWYKLEHPVCDICFRRAVWAHPAGGLRCGRCPRPSK